MENSFEPGGIFYRLLRADAARWLPKRAPFLESFSAEPLTRGGLEDELDELRHRLAESRRSTEERKTMFVRELNKLRIERDSLIARIAELEQELADARAGANQLVATRAKTVRRGLAATTGLAAAAGVVKLALSIRNAFEHRARRPRLLGPRHA